MSWPQVAVTLFMYGIAGGLISGFAFTIFHLALTNRLALRSRPLSPPRDSWKPHVWEPKYTIVQAGGWFVLSTLLLFLGNGVDLALSYPVLGIVIVGFLAGVGALAGCELFWRGRSYLFYLLKDLTPYVEILRPLVYGFIAGYGATVAVFTNFYITLQLVDDHSFPTAHTPPELWQFLYFSVTTITTIGLSDLKPGTSWAQGVAVLELIAGVLWVVFIAGLVLARVSDEHERIRKS